MTTCNICCEKFNKTLNLKITCQCGFEACKTCIRTYILSTTKDPHCMECKIQWSNKFLVDNLNRSYIDGEFKKYRKNLLVDRQISKTSELMPLVERTRIIEDKNIELDKLNEQYKEAKKIFNNISDLLYKKNLKLLKLKMVILKLKEKNLLCLVHILIVKDIYQHNINVRYVNYIHVHIVMKLLVIIKMILIHVFNLI